MDTSPYLSKYFLGTIWPRFHANFKSNRTKLEYYSECNAFADYIKKDIEKASEADAVSYLSMLYTRQANGTIKYSTIHKKYKQLASLYQYMMDNCEQFTELRLQHNPFATIIMEQKEEVIPYDKVIKVKELEHLFHYLKEHDSLCLCATRLSFEALLRLNEMITIRINDIILDANHTPCIQVVRNGSIRHNKISQDTFDDLLSYISTIPGKEFLFSKPNKEGCITMRTLQNRLQHACREAGLSNITFNDLRNTGITFSLSAGADVETVTKTLGLRSKGHITRLTSAVLNPNNTSDYVEKFIEQSMK